MFEAAVALASRRKRSLADWLAAIVGFMAFRATSRSAWVFGLEHHPHPADPQHFQNAIAAQAADFVRLFGRGEEVDQLGGRPGGEVGWLLVSGGLALAGIERDRFRGFHRLGTGAEGVSSLDRLGGGFSVFFADGIGRL